MKNGPIEADYPIDFRKDDAAILGEHLKLRHCVELVGMKRVGISNFLRFFLNHKGITPTYINDSRKHLFVPVDLNDLVEIKLFPFWILTFKRFADSLNQLPNSEVAKKRINGLFLDSIQSKDLFITIENLKIGLKVLIESGVTPTIFFIRFDRLKELVTPQLIANLQGLIDASDRNLAYVFTSYRNLDQFRSADLDRPTLSAFTHRMYIKPANPQDIKIIFDTFENHYQTNPSKDCMERLIKLAGGHVQYLHLAMIVLNNVLKTQPKATTNEIISLIEQDERITLQSEEIWDSLNLEEQIALNSLSNDRLEIDDTPEGKYLKDVGIIQDRTIFSPLFNQYINQKPVLPNSQNTDFTNKEYLLFSWLEKNLNQICDRESIIENVWPESEDLGVSDWTIDRLIARIRNKLKKQLSPYAIVTIRTRGYKLISNI